MSYQERLIRQYYSTHYTRFMPKTAERWKWVIDRIELNFGEFFNTIPRDSLILDVPCGVGYLEYYLLEKGFTRIHAVDLSEEMIQAAKDKLQECGFDYLDKVTFYLADAFEYLQRKKNSYTAIAIIDFLDHLKKDKIIELLDLANSALQAGGLLFVRVSNADNPMWGQLFFRDFTHETAFTPNSLRQCLNLTGFELLKLDYEILPPIQGLIPRFKQAIRWSGLWILAKFLGISPQAFTEDLVAVARKQ